MSSKGSTSGAGTSSGASKSTSHKRKEEKKASEGRKYAQIPKESVALYSESVGDRIGDDISKPLAEDVSYRLREVIHGCCTFLALSNHKCLTPDDVNLVLESMDVPPILGHSGGGAINFLDVREVTLFTEEDPEMNMVQMALSNASIAQKGSHFIKSMWLLPKRGPVEGAEPGPSDSGSTLPLPASLATYYKMAYRVIFGYSKKMFQVLTADFRTTVKAGPILAYVVEAMATALQEAERSGQRIVWLLDLLDALADNEAVDLSPSWSVNQLITALLHCALDPQRREGHYISADDDLRQKVAFILSKVLRRWCGSVVVREVLRKLSSMLQDLTTPLIVHRGVLHMLTAMGRAPLALCLWPLLLPPGKYTEFLDIMTTDADVLLDFEAVKGILLTAAECLSPADHPPDEDNIVELTKQRHQSSADEEQEELAREVQRVLYDQFGDAACCRWTLPVILRARPPGPEVSCGHPFPRARIFSPRPKTLNGSCVSLSDVFEQVTPRLPPLKQPLPSEPPDAARFSLDSSSLVLRQCKARSKQPEAHKTFTMHSPYQRACSNVLWIGKMHRARMFAFEISGNLRATI